MHLSCIVDDLKQARAYATDMLSHADESLWFRQPADGVNHIAWQVGHMTIAQYGLCLKRIRGVHASDEDLLPVEEYGRLFGKGSVPFPSEHEYPTPVELRTTFERVHEQVLRELNELPEDELRKSAGPAHPMFQTKGGSLNFSAKHEMLHVGQIGLLRRLLGCQFIR